MCGIGGVMHHDPARPVNPDVLVAMAAIQYHRGPDGFGVKIMSDCGVGFTHARLSIIDLNPERGRQPFVSADGQYMIAHNGEFYDYKRIRAELTSLGYRFRSKSDTELTMHLTDRYGLEGALPHLRGEFAFALYERSKDRLTLVRDRFGVKPLYWTMTPEGLVFGSEIKVLFAHPAVQRRFSSEGLYHQLMQLIVPGTSAFEGIYAVEPGQMVIVERHDGQLQVKTKQYWDLNFPRQSERGARLADEEYIEELRSRFIEAVQLRLEADVPVACYLSGGIDSCTIMGIAAASQQSPVKAFTIGFDDRDYDETAIAREMAQATGADQDVLMVDGNQLYDHFARTLWHTERSIYNTFTVAKLLMSEHVNKAGYKVVVTGEGSDELFAGYPQLRLDMILHGMDDASPEERADLEDWLAESNRLFKGNLLAEKALDDPALTNLVGFTPSCLQSWLSASAYVPSLLHPDRRAATQNYSPGEAVANALDRGQIEGRHPLDKVQYIWIKTQFESQVLGWAGDRVDMANSMEARPPFLDHPLVEFAVTLPQNMRLRGRKDKYILRETMRELLPKALYERQKFAFMAPPSHTDPIKQRAMQALSATYLSKQAIQEAGLLDAAGVQKILQRHGDANTPVSDRVQLDAIINHMLSVQMLHKHFVGNDVPAVARDRAKERGWYAKDQLVLVGA
ncbi:asparagine synthase (glutamine-hydrolyzing) [Chroococcidiopsis sp. TS-821]|uniref:asparagine synthase (glutamine-hydrolyzing) n=1 Tax=Chroococcidiopsis sp. TS-821 TaxID=1378066 RepID=UPI000CEE2227|nr:asparagine synthase (glutamine-hydrolyzing) [Chroococcidiopsis sp. TS-821]PPS43997.1 asparagine synthase (glutamine-hydrolyzing) [Chroococcidiopsis sp. TS-821]